MNSNASKASSRPQLAHLDKFFFIGKKASTRLVLLNSRQSDKMPQDHSNNDSRTPLLPASLRRHVQSFSDIAHEGESGRSGFHIRHFLHVLWLSSCNVSKWVNVLWPFVFVALVLQYTTHSMPLWSFAASYIGMIPAANLLGFAGQEFARKMPSKVAGILIETTFGSIVEIILFIVLIVKHNDNEGNGDEGNLIPIIQAAILGSVLTNLLLCLGLCFLVGGIRHQTQKFHAIVSEVGSGLLLVAAFALLIPSAFYSALKGETVTSILKPSHGDDHDDFTDGKLQLDVLKISQMTSIVLMVAFFLYIWYCASSQHSIFDEVIEMDEHRDADREQDMLKPKFTMTETMIALTMAITVVTMLLIFLVEKIEHVVEAGIPDQFLGLILLPLVEKAAEHLTAIDEAWGKIFLSFCSRFCRQFGLLTLSTILQDGVINVALYHCLAPSLQTALFNAPLVVMVGWALGKPMDLNFEIFMIVLLVLSILVVGNFLRDGESNWLEGALLVVSPLQGGTPFNFHIMQVGCHLLLTIDVRQVVYVIVAIASWYYPNPDVATSNGLTAGAEVVSVDAELLGQIRQLLQQHDEL